MTTPARAPIIHVADFEEGRGVARTMNCRMRVIEGVTERACRRCEVCRQIDMGCDLDVLELEAAKMCAPDFDRVEYSLAFGPARDRFKVVIVDCENAGSETILQLKRMALGPAHGGLRFVFAGCP